MSRPSYERAFTLIDKIAMVAFVVFAIAFGAIMVHWLWP